MSQRHPFSTVSCFRRLFHVIKSLIILIASFVRGYIMIVDKFLNWYDLNMYIINVIADDETKIGLYEIYLYFILNDNQCDHIFQYIFTDNHHKSIKKMPRCGLREVQYLKIAFFYTMEIFWEMVCSKMFKV
jgi:hypothetical protein